jgi:hypothetical protein
MAERLAGKGASRKRAKLEEAQLRFPLRLASFSPVWCCGLGAENEEVALHVFCGRKRSDPREIPDGTHEQMLLERFTLVADTSQGYLPACMDALKSMESFLQKCLDDGVASWAVGSKEVMDNLRGDLMKAFEVFYEIDEKMFDSLEVLFKRSFTSQESLTKYLRELENYSESLVNRPVLEESGVMSSSSLYSYLQDQGHDHAILTGILINPDVTSDEGITDVKELNEMLLRIDNRMSDAYNDAYGNTSNLQASMSSSGLETEFKAMIVSLQFLEEILGLLSTYVDYIMECCTFLERHVVVVLKVLEKESYEHAELLRKFAEHGGTLAELRRMKSGI